MNIEIDMNIDITEIQIFEIGCQIIMLLGTRHGQGHGNGHGYGHSEIRYQILAKMVKFNPPSPPRLQAEKITVTFVFILFVLTVHLLLEYYCKIAGKTATSPLLLLVQEKEEGIYRCRVDFKSAPTRNSLVNLTVISKFSHQDILTSTFLYYVCNPYSCCVKIRRLFLPWLFSPLFSEFTYLLYIYGLNSR
jgi:hypothetical protein